MVEPRKYDRHGLRFWLRLWFGLWLRYDVGHSDKRRRGVRATSSPRRRRFLRGVLNEFIAPIVYRTSKYISRESYDG